MFTVCMFVDEFYGEEQVFCGTLEECLQYIHEDDTDDELYIVEPDGFTVYDE